MSCSTPGIIYPEGGYDYPKSLNNTDTSNYSFPIAHLIGAKDSFNASYYGHYWGQCYNEPNLSLQPFGKDIFRLTYETAFGDASIFTLTEDEIVIKQPKSGSPYPEYDSTKLNELEKLHYSILQWNFPIKDTSHSIKSQKRLDSLAKLYPKLVDPSYYKYLIDKSAIFKKEAFTYTTKRTRISKNKFYKIVTLINSSGFWKLPYRNKCDVDFTDGFGFILEANTARKYNIVNINCPYDKSDFVKACQELINAANLDKKIKVYDEKE
jgi:hypothetical protein